MSIQEIINDTLLQEQEDRKNRTRSGKYSPSLMGCCYRRQYWNKTDEPVSEPVDVRTLRIFKVGNYFESAIVEMLKKKQNDFEYQNRIETDLCLGFADLVSTDEVIDFKTVHSKAFWYLEKSKDIVKDKFNNWLQVMWYAWKLNRKRGALVFISKDDLVISEYKQDVNDFWVNQLKEEEANLSGIKELPPAKPRAYFGKECNFCNWKTKCSQIEGEK